MGGGGFGSGGRYYRRGQKNYNQTTEHRQRMGEQKGNAPRDAGKQNSQFKDAISAAERATGKQMTHEQKTQFHREVSGKGYGFQEMVEEAMEMLK